VTLISRSGLLALGIDDRAWRLFLALDPLFRTRLALFGAAFRPAALCWACWAWLVWAPPLV
jgi:hypothetical protein